MNPLRNWIENWLFGDRLREAEARLREAGPYIEAIGEASDLYNELRERCGDIETEYATDQSVSDLSEKVDALEFELEEFKSRARRAEKQIEIMDKLLADHLDRHNQPT